MTTPTPDAAAGDVAKALRERAAKWSLNANSAWIGVKLGVVREAADEIDRLRLALAEATRRAEEAEKRLADLECENEQHDHRTACAQVALEKRAEAAEAQRDAALRERDEARNNSAEWRAIADAALRREAGLVEAIKQAIADDDEYWTEKPNTDFLKGWRQGHHRALKGLRKALSAIRQHAGGEDNG